jgi:hypothetical protein
MMDWQIAIAIGALFVALASMFSRSFDKSLTIREHEEFRASINAGLAQLRADMHRDNDRIERRVDVLEQTRPTTGELEARLNTNRKS